MTTNTKIYADGASIEEISDLINVYSTKGFTTNPSLIKKLGVKNYESYCRKFIEESQNLPVSFEVFADDFNEMERQARLISSWGNNVYVKIPITNSERRSTVSLITDLQSDNIKVNVTAVFTKDQIDALSETLSHSAPSIVSIFAGRIADTGVSPLDNISYAVNRFRKLEKIEVLWASVREIFNVYEAIDQGCDIITVQPSLIPKLKLKNKSLSEFSLETVKMFRNDALTSGYFL